MEPKTFAFNLGQSVVITASGETGTVRGRAEYVNSEPSYFVHYKAGDGKAVSDWWPESLLSAG